MMLRNHCEIIFYEKNTELLLVEMPFSYDIDIVEVFLNNNIETYHRFIKTER